MTKQEAINNIKAALPNAHAFKEEFDVLENKPKKVIKETISDAYDCDDRSIDFEYEIKKCPNCDFDLVNETEGTDFEDWDYCPNCGQKLDWSDE